MDKELTALEALSNLFKYACNYKVDENHRLGNSKEWKDIIKKDLKALEIIKNKYVDIGFVKSTKNYEEYINDYEVKYLYKEEYILTKEEYELLKEVLL